MSANVGAGVLHHMLFQTLPMTMQWLLETFLPDWVSHQLTSWKRGNTEFHHTTHEPERCAWGYAFVFYTQEPNSLWLLEVSTNSQQGVQLDLLAWEQSQDLALVFPAKDRKQQTQDPHLPVESLPMHVSLPTPQYPWCPAVLPLCAIFGDLRYVLHVHILLRYVKTKTQAEKNNMLFCLHLFYLKTIHFKPQINWGRGYPTNHQNNDYIVRWGLDV